MVPTRREFAWGALACAAFSQAGRAAISDPQTLGASGIDLKSMDRSFSPGNDFFRYVNGTWLRDTPIPSDRGRWIEFTRLDDLNTRRNRAILEAAASSPRDPEEIKLGDFYASLMDETGIEARGLVPLKPELARITAIATPADLARALAQLSRDALPVLPGGGGAIPTAPVAPGVAVDIKNPTRYLPSLSQGGIGLPDRDYFLIENNPGFAKARDAYRLHLAAMFRLAGMDDVEARAARVYALEERIARSHWTRVEMRDPAKRYNLFPRADLAAKFPGLDWDAFLQTAGFDGQAIIQVTEPSALAGVAAAAREVPLADWRDYLAYRVVRGFALAAPNAIIKENFAFEDKILAGTPELPARWKRAGAIMDRAMGHAVGRIYLASYFPPAVRARADAMTRNIKLAMGKRIQALPWMADATKARALAKLRAVHIEIGGQQPLRTYENLTVAKDDAYGNVLRAARVSYQRNLDKLGKPVDRGEWQMVPQTVNAQANPVMQKIMFPAGIMQGLFFNPHAEDAVNYGGIGVVMGHELSHHFDDQGAKFDEHGALNDWWTPGDLAHFTAATEALAKQYDGYEPLPGTHINGHLTLGENAADLAGLAVALDAYRTSLGGKPGPAMDGFTAEQRFFMGYAQIYRSLSREDYMRQALATDPHSPGEWRSAEVRNVDAWYTAFAVAPGQKMYLAPDQRVKIW
ncbi:MAG TPA: M13 family metallopeptidase [Rhizomicrobium sp.]|nr:M13 family metallopeptidase [Rhizomicrobium sp.]